jgi:phenylacetate-coenzyme A ligase PaaK-like adenylate-forming protein
MSEYLLINDPKDPGLSQQQPQVNQFRLYVTTELLKQFMPIVRL